MDLNRRHFLKSTMMAAGGILALPFSTQLKVEIPVDQRLGRICAGGEGARFELKARPDINSPKVGTVYRDDIIVWLREVVASPMDLNRISQRWVETPNGYVYAPYVQPVKNLPNLPVDDVPIIGKEAGAWVEVTIPYVDFTTEGGAKAPWLKENLKPRLYYSQVMWMDMIKSDNEGRIYYRIFEKFGSYGDVFWALGEAFKLIKPEDILPIHPEVKEKRVEVDVTYQTLSCFEGEDEVYFCRVSTGYGGATPLGVIPVWRKMISTHMSGGSTGYGFDTPGIGWTSLFSNDGAAIHSTFWHNEFGLARSHGCVNTTPEDAQWIFRWITPEVLYDPGDVVIYGMEGSTRITVKE